MVGGEWGGARGKFLPVRGSECQVANWGGREREERGEERERGEEETKYSGSQVID